MILSASRRTDIPAYYSEWMLNRLKQNDILIPNPYDANRLSRVRLSPEDVDCIVFWTKNPAPMLRRLDEIERMGYRFYFQFTLTPYDQTIERNLPAKAEIVRTFRELSRKIGPERVVWRYDPVIVDRAHPVEWHLRQFRSLCEALHRDTRRCVFSYLDPYARLGNRFSPIGREDMLAVARGFSEIAEAHRLPLFTCAETIDLSRFHIGHSACIDPKLVEQIIGCPIRSKKDAGQRPACGCAESVDIGAYDTCLNGCVYCYATSGDKAAQRRALAHDPASPMLTGTPRGGERISDRTAPSQKITQLSLF